MEHNFALSQCLEEIFVVSRQNLPSEVIEERKLQNEGTSIFKEFKSSVKNRLEDRSTCFPQITQVTQVILNINNSQISDVIECAMSIKLCFCFF